MQEDCITDLIPRVPLTTVGPPVERREGVLLCDMVGWCQSSKLKVQSSLYCFPYIDVQQTSMVKYNKYMSTKECICLQNSETDQTPYLW